MQPSTSIFTDLANAIRRLTTTVTVTFHGVTDHVECQQSRAGEITGLVIIQVIAPVQITGIDIELMGESRTNPLTTAHVPDNAWRLSHHAWELNARNLKARDRMSHLARRCHRSTTHTDRGPRYPCQVNGSIRRPIVLKNNFRFQLRRPVPESWRGNEAGNASVRYWLTTRVRYVPTGRRWFGGRPTPQTETATHPIILTNSFPLSREEMRNKNTRITMKMVKTGWGELAPVMCCLHLPCKSVVRGEILPVSVLIENHSSSTIRSASLEFLQVFTIRSRKVPERTLEVTQGGEGGRLWLEPVAGNSRWRKMVLGLRVPATSLSSGSFPRCPLISVRFIVRLKLLFWLCDMLTCDVECQVYTCRSYDPSDYESKPLVNVNGLPFFPADAKDRLQKQSLPFTLLNPSKRRTV